MNDRISILEIRGRVSHCVPRHTFDLNEQRFDRKSMKIDGDRVRGTLQPWQYYIWWHANGTIVKRHGDLTVTLLKMGGLSRLCRGNAIFAAISRVRRRTGTC